MTADSKGTANAGKTLRCATIGVGKMGRHHARLYATTEGCDLVGVVDGNADRAGKVVEEWGGRAFASIEELIAAGVDAVTVATPTVTHRAIVEPLLKAGIACLVEKPLAPDVTEARAIADMARQTGSLLQVGHVVRYDPVMVAVRNLVSAGSIRPRFIEIDRVSPMTFRSVDVGVVLDMMIHDLDVLLALMGGEPEEIHANAVCVVGEAEDVCNARLVFPAGPDGIRCTANVTASRLALKTERKIRLISEDAYVSADFVEKKGTVVRKTANASQLADVRERLRRGEDLSGVNYLEMIAMEPLAVGTGEPLKLQLLDFLDAVRANRRPLVNAEDGFAAVRTAERIVAAARAAGARMV
jgi:predicted dehydrogenase